MVKHELVIPIHELDAAGKQIRFTLRGAWLEAALAPPADDEAPKKPARKGDEAGIPTPTNKILTEIVTRVEKGELKPDPKHIIDLRLN